MPNENTTTDIAHSVALATITQQVASLVEGMVRTERQLEKLNPMNDALNEMRVSLALKADTAALVAVDAKVASWIGHVKGALTVATLAVGLVQTALIGGGAYIITHLQQHETNLAVVSSRLDAIERGLRPNQTPQNGSKTRWAIFYKRSISS
jgi:hypothetical protein